MRTAERKMELQIAAPGVSIETRWNVALNGMAKLARSIMNRMAVNKLTDMTDQQLTDIGLTRGDVVSALEAGFLDDPSMHLARAARTHSGTRFTWLRKP